PASITAIAIGGLHAGDFTLTADSCSGATVGAGARCGVSVTVQPTAGGARSAWLRTTANARAADVALLAEGVAVTLEWSALSIDFGNIKAGTRSPRHTVSFTNTGNE